MNGMPVGVVDGTFDTVSFVRTDHIGRPVFATNQNGTKVWAARYLPFGQVQTSGGDNIDLRFPGQWFNSMTGFHQNWMRDYDPTLGRYLQADPLGLIDGPSVYGYAYQSPQMNTDPTGLYCMTKNGQTTCGVKGKYEVSFPKSNSWDDNSRFGPGTNTNGFII